MCSSFWQRVLLFLWFRHFRACFLGKVCFRIRKDRRFRTSLPGPVAHPLRGGRLFEGMNPRGPRRPAGVQVLRHVQQGADRPWVFRRVDLGPARGLPQRQGPLSLRSSDPGRGARGDRQTDGGFGAQRSGVRWCWLAFCPGRHPWRSLSRRVPWRCCDRERGSGEARSPECTGTDTRPPPPEPGRNPGRATHPLVRWQAGKETPESRRKRGRGHAPGSETELNPGGQLLPPGLTQPPSALTCSRPGRCRSPTPRGPFAGFLPPPETEVRTQTQRQAGGSCVPFSSLG